MHEPARKHWAALACLATVLAGTMVLAGAATESAEAATAATCKTKATGSTGGVPAELTATITAPEPAPILDVKVSLSATASNNRTGELTFTLRSPSTVESPSKSVTIKDGAPDFLGLPDTGTHPQLVDVVLTDSAASSIQQKTTPPGSYKPSSALSALQGTDARGEWTLEVGKAFGSLGSPTGTVSSWKLDITYDCDRDKDSVRNLKDNCPDAINLNQADRDKDGVGDVCDPDVDGDGVPNATDNCPRHANANQRDMDGDGKGDRCDDDADNDGFTNGDACPLIAARTDSGCPEVKRKVTAKFKAGKRVLTGKVKAQRKKGACQRRTTVRLYRGSQVVASSKTNKQGRYTFRVPRRAGKYYAFTPFELHPKKAKFGCFDAQSKKFKVKAR